LVKHVNDWPYSTFHHYVALGLYPPDWSSDTALLDIDEEGH
jgi:putative transposase